MVEQDFWAYTPYRICERRKKSAKYTDCPLQAAVLSVSLVLCCAACLSTATPLPDDGPLKVRQLHFSKQLENPCRLSEDAPRARNATPQERRKTRLDVVRQLKARVVLLNDTAATILRTNMLRDCSILPQSLVARVPFADDVSNDKPLDVLRDFYASLLNHTAHVYFISEQLSQYSGQTCYGDSSLHQAADTLSSNMLELMCVLRFCMLTLPEDEGGYGDNIFKDLTDQMLGEPLLDLPVCARRQLRDCTTVYSTVTLLTEMTSYLRDRVLVENEPS